MEFRRRKLADRFNDCDNVLTTPRPGEVGVEVGAVSALLVVSDVIMTGYGAGGEHQRSNAGIYDGSSFSQPSFPAEELRLDADTISEVDFVPRGFVSEPAEITRKAELVHVFITQQTTHDKPKIMAMLDTCG
jgi:hypothetical protein